MSATHHRQGVSHKTSRRRLSLAISTAAAVAVISAGASALAASGSAHPAHAATITTRTNFRFVAAGRASARPAVTPHVTTVTEHYSLAASAFAPDGLHNTSTDYFNQWDPSTLSNTDSGRCFNAGLSLPPRVTLKSITVYYTEGSTEMYFEINQQDLATQTATEIVSFDSATTTSTPVYTSTTETFPTADAVVNMGKYAYSAGVCPNGNTTFSGLNITYTLPAS